MAAALPYMPLFVADYLADTAHLSALEHGAYLLLIMNYWQRGKALPSDDGRLARIARVSDDEWRSIRPVLAEFFAHGDGVWMHDRIESELDKVRDKSAKARAAGQRSASARMVIRPAVDEQTLNACSTDVQQTFNHTDTDTDTKKNISPRKSADLIKSNLEAVLSPAMAEAVIAHRIAKKAKLTPKAAELLAARFAETVNPEAAAALMIERGWQGFDPKWAGALDPPKVVTLITGPTLKSDYTDEELLADLEPSNACGH